MNDSDDITLDWDFGTFIHCTRNRTRIKISTLKNAHLRYFYRTADRVRISLLEFKKHHKYVVLDVYKEHCTHKRGDKPLSINMSPGAYSILIPNKLDICGK